MTPTESVEVTVYVVERGCYSDRYLSGVFGSLTEAKEGQPHDPPGTGEVEWNKDRSWWTRTDPDGWTETGRSDGSSTRWTNGLDWDDAVSIEAHTVTIKVPADATSSAP